MRPASTSTRIRRASLLEIRPPRRPEGFLRAPERADLPCGWAQGHPKPGQIRGQRPAGSRMEPGAAVANMTEQTGIYLLHDFRDIVYVGRATESTLGTRLSAHTRDRLKTRWNRFSWFGFRPVEENGTLGQIPNTYGLRDVVVAMEAVLIEALEPPQNRKGGDGFHGIEYIQAEDPDKAKERLISEFEHLIRRGHRG